MTISDTGLTLVKKFEGFVPKLYYDVGGLPHIGYGCRLFTAEEVNEYKDREITEAEATGLLRSRLSPIEQKVNEAVAVPLTQNQFDALTSLAYNIGGSAFASSTLVRQLNAGDYENARAEFARWNKVGGVANAGLSSRRQQEADLFWT